MNKDPKS